MLARVRGAARVALAIGIGGPACAAPPGGTFPPPIAELVAANRAVGDPYEGRFPLERALQGLPPGERLVATLATDEGEIACVLDASHAPLNVASFVGLARGLRPYRHADGTWSAEPYYVDMPWHRAEADQFVQTGRRGALEDGGFFLQDEVSPGDDFTRAGVLAMAGTGEPHSASVQFFVTTGPTLHLRGEHTILGTCEQEAIVRRVERRVAAGEAPRLRSVRIERTAGG